MVLNDKVYDVIKWLVQIFFPAADTLYAALAALWGFPCVEQVVGTIGAITVFLGACLKISNSNYAGDAVLHVDPNADDDNQYSLALSSDWSELAKKKSFMVTVNNKKSQE